MSKDHVVVAVLSAEGGKKARQSEEEKATRKKARGEQATRENAAAKEDRKYFPGTEAEMKRNSKKSLFGSNLESKVRREAERYGGGKGDGVEQDGGVQLYSHAPGEGKMQGVVKEAGSSRIREVWVWRNPDWGALSFPVQQTRESPRRLQRMGGYGEELEADGREWGGVGRAREVLFQN
ncbi:hypothetical protein BDZ91DRAFT_795792 [Kalaharituber pfeilii]|nr:hypothetical protein BDZ91DRAFT_795792 [Kalaharituber pfeilii]